MATRRKAIPDDVEMSVGNYVPELNGGMSVTQIAQILFENEDKNFVRRIISPHKYPVLDNPDGSVSTHLMAYAGPDEHGQYIVFPTIVQRDEGMLSRLEGRKSLDYALKKREYVLFDNEQDAADFSQNYKKIWDWFGQKMHKTPLED